MDEQAKKSDAVCLTVTTTTMAVDDGLVFPHVVVAQIIIHGGITSRQFAMLRVNLVESNMHKRWDGRYKTIVAFGE